MQSAFLSKISAFIERRLAVVHDDLSSPRRSVMVAPAADISETTVNTVITEAAGLCFVAVSPARAGDLLLSQMSRPSTVPSSAAPRSNDPAICVSVEAREGVSTGISAADRAATIRVLGEAQPNPRKLVHPGHIFPIVTRAGGTLVRNALPEAVLDVVTLAGFTDAALYVELLNEHGEIGPNSKADISTRPNLPEFSISEIIQHRLNNEELVSRVAEARLPTRIAGELRSIAYKSHIFEGEHLALVKGDPAHADLVLVRVQSEFTFGDVFGGGTPPTRTQISAALTAMRDAPSAVLIYLRRSKPGQLAAQISAWQTKFSEKPAATMREFGLGAQILRDIGVRKVRLLTAHARHIVGLETFGIKIVETVPLPDIDAPTTTPISRGAT